jgi:hypothetical protein
MFTRRTLVPMLLTAGALAAAVFTVSSAHAGARSTVKVINNSGTAVVSIHSSPTYRTGYGRIDLLGDLVLRSGYNVHVDFDTPDAENQCVQDVVARGANGQHWKRRMNVCTTTTWTLGD